jgi:hypothetical protein
MSTLRIMIMITEWFRATSEDEGIPDSSTHLWLQTQVRKRIGGRIKSAGRRRIVAGACHLKATDACFRPEL